MYIRILNTASIPRKKVKSPNGEDVDENQKNI